MATRARYAGPPGGANVAKSQARHRGGAPLEVYLETNAFSDLFRSQSSRELQLRRDLRTTARSRQIVYVTSGWTIEELAGIAEHDERKYRRVVRFLLDLVGDNQGLLDDPPTLAGRELRLGRELRGSERMLPRHRDYRRAALDVGWAREVAQQTRRENLEGKVEMTGMRETVWERLAELAKDDERAKGDPRKATLLWWQEADRWIDEWSRNTLMAVLKENGMDPAIARTYPLERVPTVLNMTAGMMARVVWNSGHGRRIDEGDNVDTRHYVAACYSDIFVSSDRRLGEIIDQLPSSPVRPMTLDEFARRHLGW